MTTIGPPLDHAATRGGSPTSTFTEVMAGHAAAVAVITVLSDGMARGLAVTSLCSYSASPPSVMVAVATASRTHDHLVARRSFGVNLLAAGQEDVAAVFAGRSERKFDELAWCLERGVPRLDGVRAFLACRRAAALEHGDHTVLIGDVLDVEGAADREPLIHFRRSTCWSLTEGDQR